MSSFDDASISLLIFTYFSTSHYYMCMYYVYVFNVIVFHVLHTFWVFFLDYSDDNATGGEDEVDEEDEDEEPEEWGKFLHLKEKVRTKVIVSSLDIKSVKLKIKLHASLVTAYSLVAYSFKCQLVRLISFFSFLFLFFFLFSFFLAEICQF